MINKEIHPKIWGSEEWIYNGEYCGKILNLKQGYGCSKHYHKLKHECFLIISGTVLLQHAGMINMMYSDDAVEIKPEEEHRFIGITDAKIIEFSSHHDEQDSYRSSVSGMVSPEELQSLIHYCWKRDGKIT